MSFLFGGHGILAWVLRYVFFAFEALDPTVWMILTGIALHGICYDFFFVTGQIYVDLKSNDKIRGQAQGLIVLITYGTGLLIGVQLSGIFYGIYFILNESLLRVNNSFLNWKSNYFGQF